MRRFPLRSHARRTLCASFVLAALSAIALPTAHAQNQPQQYDQIVHHLIDFQHL